MRGQRLVPSTSLPLPSTSAMPYPLVLQHARLPWEVIEHVIDILHSDIPTLRQFALTCSVLLPRSRYHIFFSIRFQPILQDVSSLCNIFDDNPPLADLVHVVTVRLPNGSRRPTKSFVEVFPAQLIKRFPRLRHWRLFTGATPSPESPLSFHRATLAFLRATLRIQALDLTDLTFTSNAELGSLLASLPLLRDLQCSNIKCKNTASPTAGDTARRRHHRSLRSLCVRDA